MSGALMFVGRGVPEALRLSLLRGQGLVGGNWVSAASGKTFPVLNPANGHLIAQVSAQRWLAIQWITFSVQSIPGPYLPPSPGPRHGRGRHHRSH